MALDLTTASSLSDSIINQLNSPVEVSQEKENPILIKTGFHAGYIDYSKSLISAFHGVGFNQFGIYGIEDGEARFLLSAKTFLQSGGWGKVEAGEFRVGTDVSADDSGTISSSSYMRYRPSDGWTLAGIATSDSTDTFNLIASNSFDSSTNFATDGSVVYHSSGGNLGAYYSFNGEGTLTQKTGINCTDTIIIRGKIDFSTSDFSGTLLVKIFGYDENNVFVTSSSTVISTYNSSWETKNYAVRLDDSTNSIKSFKLQLAVVNYISGTLNVDNWEAYRVNQTAIFTGAIPEVMADPDTGLVFDKQGLRGFFRGTKKFDIQTASGNAYFAGSVRVSGYVHTGDAAVGDIEGHTYWDGCGLNEYGVYGVRYTSVEVPHFLLTAKSFSGNSLWGDAESGELRVGDNVKESGGTLLGSSWLWFSPSNGLQLSDPIISLGTNGNININTSGYIHSGPSYSSGDIEGCGLNEYGVYGVAQPSGSEVPKFILAAKSFSGNPLWGDVDAGEFRIGDNVKNTDGNDEILDTDHYFWYHPTNGLRMKGDVILGSNSSISWNNITDKSGVVESGDSISHLHWSTTYLSGKLVYSPILAGDEGYISGIFKVGSGSNNIEINYNSGSPFIKSGNYSGTGPDSTGWKIAYNGNIYCSKVLSTSGWFWLGTDEWTSGSNVGFIEGLDTTFETHDPALTIGFDLSNGDSNRIKLDEDGVSIITSNDLSIDSNKLGFFDVTAVSQQSTSSATISDIVTVLKNYGLLTSGSS